MLNTVHAVPYYACVYTPVSHSHKCQHANNSDIGMHDESLHNASVTRVCAFRIALVSPSSAVMKIRGWGRLRLEPEWEQLKELRMAASSGHARIHQTN